MSARYEFKVGPGNRNSDYAQPVTVIADSYPKAKLKAIDFRGFDHRDSAVWLIRIDEVPEAQPSAEGQP